MAYVRILVSGSLSSGAADYVLKEDIGRCVCSVFTAVWTARRRLSNHSSTTVHVSGGANQSRRSDCVVTRTSSSCKIQNKSE